MRGRCRNARRNQRCNQHGSVATVLLDFRIPRRSRASWSPRQRDPCRPRVKRAALHYQSKPFAKLKRYNRTIFAVRYSRYQVSRLGLQLDGMLESREVAYAHISVDDEPPVQGFRFQYPAFSETEFSTEWRPAATQIIFWVTCNLLVVWRPGLFTTFFWKPTPLCLLPDAISGRKPSRPTLFRRRQTCPSNAWTAVTSRPPEPRALCSRYTCRQGWYWERNPEHCHWRSSFGALYPAGV